MAETLARVHTHTHTPGNLIDKKISMKYALLNVYKTGCLYKYNPVCFLYVKICY